MSKRTQKRLISIILAVIGLGLIALTRLHLDLVLNHQRDWCGVIYYGVFGLIFVGLALQTNNEIQTRYQYIHFDLVGKKPKTNVYACLNNASGICLGHIKYYPQWRQYCFFPEFDMVFSAGCLMDIQNFMKQLR